MKKVLLFSLMLMGILFAGCQKSGSNERTPKNDENAFTPDADWADYVITLEFSTLSTTKYGFVDIDYSTVKHSNGKYIHELLGYDDFDELLDGLGELAGDKGNPYETGAEVLYLGNDAVTGQDFRDNYNTNWNGYWCNAAGSKEEWGDNARIFSEGGIDDEGHFMVSVGVMDGKITSGETYVCRMVFQKADDEGVVRVGIVFKVTIEGFSDPEAALYDASKRKTGEFTLDNVGLDVPINVFYDAVTQDLAKIQDYLQLTKYQLNQLGEPEINQESGALVKGLQVIGYVNGEVMDKSAGGVAGTWMKDLTTSGAWGADTGAWFIELHMELDAIYVSVGTMPGSEEEPITPLVADLEGKCAEYTQVLTYIPEAGDEPTVITLNYIVNFLSAR